MKYIRLKKLNEQKTTCNFILFLILDTYYVCLSWEVLSFVDNYKTNTGIGTNINETYFKKNIRV